LESCWGWDFEFLPVAYCQACCILGNIFHFSFLLSSFCLYSVYIRDLMRVGYYVGQNISTYVYSQTVFFLNLIMTLRFMLLGMKMESWYSMLVTDIYFFCNKDSLLAFYLCPFRTIFNNLSICMYLTCPNKHFINHLCILWGYITRNLCLCIPYMNISLIILYPKRFAVVQAVITIYHLVFICSFPVWAMNHSFTFHLCWVCISLYPCCNA
jgi:hypothetical protein